ncbi:MAG: hypothetical protein K2X43_10640 [Hyphomonadaceae bacterium]|jgi:hypothetical protein|nr:hypothetical protein [Hyphomonadaceae bacterium]
MRVRAGDRVRVRSKEEILGTLDKNGRLDGLPFMPQMFQYCGQEFEVYMRAHKTCDTVSGNYVNRKLPDGVHLNLRCDGKAYDGCQAGCLLFWKEAWLEPLAAVGKGKAPSPGAAPSGPRPRSQVSCTEEDVLAATRAPKTEAAEETRYICQATALLDFTSPLKWWDARQYVEDYTSGNASLGRLFRGFVYTTLLYGTLAHRYRLGRPARWLHEKMRFLWRGKPLPRALGKIPLGQAKATSDLHLHPGELVRVKSHEAILATIDMLNRNRGMSFDQEMAPYCGRTFRVRTRVENFVDEKTGKMKQLKTPAVILEGAVCGSRYSDHRMFCPRSIYSWWREIWLERVPDKPKP